MLGRAEADRALEAADDAFGRHDVEGVVAHLSTAIRAFTAADETCLAAMACVRLGDTYANTLGNHTAGRAWYTRAMRLVEQEPPCVEQGWVAVAAMGCDVDDPVSLLASAELALDRARRFGDLNLETKALADAGLAHVQLGHVGEGMAMLDEAMALACGPADDTLAAGKSVCSFFTACYYSGDFVRAGSWADLLREHGLIGLTPGGPLFLSSHCDSVQATSLIELGRWADAEALLVRAKSDFEAAMMMPSWHPDIALADLRTRQGRFTEAEALLLGKSLAMQAFLPAARLHLERGDHDLARIAARRGLRVLGGDRLRAVELLSVLVDAELALGDLPGAGRAVTDLAERIGDLDIPVLQVRSATAQARTQAASGHLDGSIAILESAIDRLDAHDLPWMHATVLLDLAGIRERAGDRLGAGIDANAARGILDRLDVVLQPAHVALLRRLGQDGPIGRSATPAAELVRDGKWWTVSFGGTRTRLADTKGLRYLAELLAGPGRERHVFDLVDRVEGVAPAGGVDRRALGDAGEMLDARARTDYRRRIEQLHAEIDDALEAGRLETAESAQAEIDQLVAQLASAFGIGGRTRKTSSAAERARLNVTRALRSAIGKVADVAPALGADLDRRVRTGLYCAYDPAPDAEVRWIVQS